MYPLAAIPHLMQEVSMLTSEVKSFEYGPGIAETDTRAGRLRGMRRNGVYTFLGVKYADAGRFEKPRPVAPWSGVKEAIIHGPIAPSPVPFTHPGSRRIVSMPNFWPSDENCQYLNIWSPSLNPYAKKPVMFWLHGGGGAFGDNLDQDGEGLSKYGDVVVVTVTHRLNSLGLLDLSAYSEEYADSCNNSYNDLIAALKWVGENIANFGGDPDNVTLFGHSGGGGKVLNLLQMPPADGLYHKAIIMAGILPETMLYPPRSYTRQLAANTLKLLGLEEKDFMRLKTMDYGTLCTASLQAMREAAAATGYRATWSQPVSEGFFKGFPLEVGIRREMAKVPLLIGSVQGERNSDVRRWCTNPVIIGSNKNTWDAGHTEKAMRIWFGEKYDAVREAFPRAYPEKKLQDSIFTDMGHRASILKVCNMRCEVEEHADTFLYYFNAEFPVNGGTVAWHGSELPFVFHSATYCDPLWLPHGRTEQLEKEMCTTWATFARTGNPNNPLIPHLPAYDPEHYGTLVWGDETTVRYDHDRALVDLLPQLTLPNDISGYGMG